MTTDVEKTHLLTQAIALAERSSGTGGPPRTDVGPLLQAYYRHVSTDDVGDRSAEDAVRRAGLALPHRRHAPAGHRPRPRLHADPGRARLVGRRPLGGRGRHRRHALPRRLGRRWSSPASSATSTWSSTRSSTWSATSPGGWRRSPAPTTSPRSRPRAPSASRGCTSRSAGSATTRTSTRSPLDVQRVLRDVRESVEDWDKMRQQARGIVEELRADPPARSRARSSSAAAPSSSGWPTTTSPSSATASTTSSATGRRLPARRARHRARHPARRPGHVVGVRQAAGQVAEKAREKTLLVLAKANSRSTVHRPAYLDYVGVKTFDDAGEVVGERRFLGLLLERGLHRVGLADPAAARAREGRPPPGRPRSRTATPARP